MARKPTNAKRAATGSRSRKTKSPAKTAKPEEKSVSGTELAGLLADPPFSDRWLRELSDRGYVVKSGRGRYDLAASVQGYIRFVRETEVEAVKEAANSKEQFEAERARKLKLENDKREALLVETTDAFAAIDLIVGNLSAELENLPSQLSEDIAERRRIEKVIDAVRAGLARRLEQAVSAIQEGRDPLEAADEELA